MQLSSVFGVDTSINPKYITMNPYHFISTLLNANSDFDVSVANDLAIDVAKWALTRKVMQGSPCPEVCTLNLVRTPFNVLLRGQIWKYPSLSMHLLHRMNAMLDFIWSPPERKTEQVNITKNRVHDRIQTTNTAWPPDYKSTVFITRSILQRYTCYNVYLYDL